LPISTGRPGAKVSVCATIDVVSTNCRHPDPPQDGEGPHICN
jgi:hypothetical protein